MQVNVQKFLEDAGVKEPFYPGKRIILPCAQTGEFKSHCVVLDWRIPEKIRLEIKPGLTGKDLEPKKLKKYPVSLQMPTYVEIEVINDNEEAEEGEEEKGKSKSGKSGSGGKKPAANKMVAAFGDVVDGKIPALGKIVEMVVMGSEIAAEAFGDVLKKLTKQISHAKISTTELLAQAGKMITKVMPPSFMAPKGDETVKYKYDQEKNADIGFKMTLG
ncbi:MAG: hypothetical protein DHS20C02_19350 [Micavibrio sp.]|nr:MAG: hypothetical protein DHS20C02_19350 [Micavibrio sp.]